MLLIQLACACVVEQGAVTDAVSIRVELAGCSHDSCDGDRAVLTFQRGDGATREIERACATLLVNAGQPRSLIR